MQILRHLLRMFTEHAEDSETASLQIIKHL